MSAQSIRSGRRFLGFAPRAAIAWLVVICAGGIFTLLIPAPAAGAPLQSPAWAHWLGTDLLGRDFAWRMMAGGARTLAVAAGATLLSVLIGGLWGIAAGMSESRAGWVLDRLMEILLAIPALVLALIILAALGPGAGAVVIAVGAGGAASFARLLRTEAAQIRNREYFLASRALGAGRLRMAVRHLLPNLAGPLAAYGALHFGWALVNAASLTFLGFGGSPSVPDWGRILGEARLVFLQAPGEAAAPALALAATVLAVQSLGRWASERSGL